MEFELFHNPIGAFRRKAVYKYRKKYKYYDVGL